MPEPTPLRPDAGMPWPAPLDEAAYHGLAGEIVRALDPHTEADPVGVLVTVLAGFGNAVGRGPHLVLDHARHGLTIWPVLVGPTGTGRKGTALSAAGAILGRALPAWWERREGGLSSGEGLIHRVRDATTLREPVKIKGQVTGYQEVISDQGVEDKRLFVVESEFGSVLQVMGRERSTLGMVLRNAWDGSPLGTMTRSSALRATGAHIAITGHITPDELRGLLSERDALSGFGNRFLWFCVRRSKLLPLGGQADEGELVALAQIFERTVEDARALGRLWMDEEAKAAWIRVYESLASDDVGVVGGLLSRAEASVQRLAGIYAALDVSPRIQQPHLEAALALWGYMDASVRCLFGAAALATQRYRSMILAALAGGSLTQTEIVNDLFGRNLQPPEPHATLSTLHADGLIAPTYERPPSGRGRNITRWTITERGRQEAQR